MKRDGLLGLIFVTFFILSSAAVYAAEKPKTGTPPKKAAASSSMNQNKADAIGKSCDQWQKRREEVCKKAAPEKKKLKDSEQGSPVVKKECTGETSGKEKKLCDDEKRFVMSDKQYGVEYQYTCDYEGKLGDRDRLSPAFRAEVATGETKNIAGRGYCVADYRIRDLFKDKAKCAQAGKGDGYGTQTDPKSKDNCRGGVVQMAGDFDEKVVAELDKTVRCFQASTGQGEKAKKGEVGVISGYAGDAKRRIISFCRDDQKEVSDILKKKAEEGALAYDKEAKKFVGTDPKTDEDKAKAKESIKNAPFAPDASAVNPGDTKSQPKNQTGVVAGDKSEKARIAALEKTAVDTHAAAPVGSEARRILEERRAASEKAEAALKAFSEDPKRKGDTAEYTRLVEAEARANARYNRSISLDHYNQWLKYYQSQPQTEYTRIYLKAYRAALPK